MPDFEASVWLKARVSDLLHGRQQKLLQGSLSGEAGASRFFSERHLLNPRLDTLCGIADDLGVSLFELFGVPKEGPESPLVEELRFILENKPTTDEIALIELAISSVANKVAQRLDEATVRKRSPQTKAPATNKQGRRRVS